MGRLPGWVLLGVLLLSSSAWAQPYWTKTTLTVSPTPSVLGATVTLSVSTCVYYGTDCSSTVGGDIELFADDVLLTTFTNPFGSYDISTLTAGTHTLQAIFYPGGKGSSVPYFQSSDTKSHFVSNNSLSIDSGGGYLRWWSEPITLSAQLTPLGGETATPGGTVTYYDKIYLVNNTWQTTLLGTANVDATGLAQLVVSNLEIYLWVGNHYIYAVYSGDATYSPSEVTSSPISIMKAKSEIYESSAYTYYGAPQILPLSVRTTAPSTEMPDGSINAYQYVSPQNYQGGTSIVDGHGAIDLGSYRTPGTHAFKLVYGGHSRIEGVTSYGWISVQGAPTQTTLTVPATATIGDTVTLTATLVGTAPGSYAIEGATVNFYDGSTFLGSATTSGGVATLQVSSLGVGAHTLRANFSQQTGTSNYCDFTSCTYSTQVYRYASQSANQTLTISTASTATTLAAAPSPTVYGEPVTLTANVTRSGGSAAAGGSVTFKVGTTTLGSATLTSGTATLVTTALPLGDSTIEAQYAGSSSDSASSNTTSHTVTQAASTLTLTASPASPSTYGVTVTFLATVAPAAPSAKTPTGSVTFYDGGIAIATVVLNSGGLAARSVTMMARGTHAITAEYLGSAGHTGSTGSLDHFVDKAAATCSAFGVSWSYATPTSLTMTVGPGATATGSVTVKDGGAEIAVLTMANGSVALDATAFGIGLHQLTWEYGGSDDFSTCTVATNHTISRAPVVVSLVSLQNPTPAGQNSLLVATVAPKYPISTGKVPSGTVQLIRKSDKVVLATATLDAAGQGQFSVSLPPGNTTVYASYTYDAYFGLFGPIPRPTVSADVVQSVGGQTSTTTVASSKNPATHGESVTLTATVTAATTPTGSVTFTDGADTLGTATLDGTGKATLVTTAIAAGTRTIVATYSGSTLYASSAGSLIQGIDKTATTTTVVAAPVASTLGDAVTFSATVKRESDDAAPTSGTVSFWNGAVELGTATLDAGKATLVIGTLPVGSTTVTARFAATDSEEASEGSVVHAVAARPTTTTLTATPGSGPYGGDVVIEATVTSTVGTPDGTVSFTSDSVAIGSAPLVAGKASLTINTLLPGAHALVATYAGATEYQGGSSTGSVTITKLPTTITLAGPTDPVAPLTPFTLTATVTSAAAPLSGTVEFRTSPGGTLLGVGTLDAEGKATFLSKHASGNWSFYATYAGNTYYATATSAIALVVVGGQAATVALASSANPGTRGASITFTATVTAAGGTPTGTVTFTAGTTTLGTASLDETGAVSVATSTLPEGDTQIVATYNGSAVHGTAQGSLSQTINKAPTTSSVVATPSPGVEGLPVVLVSKVSFSTLPPTGKVELFVDGNKIGEGTVDGVGEATLATTLAAGTYTIGATYLGDADHTGSMAPSITLIVDPYVDLGSPDLVAEDLLPGEADLAPVASADLLVPPVATDDLLTPPVATDDLLAPPVATDDLLAPPVATDDLLPVAEVPDLLAVAPAPDLTEAPVADLTAPVDLTNAPTDTPKGASKSGCTAAGDAPPTRELLWLLLLVAVSVTRRARRTAAPR